jgi:hypothetical protein
MGRFLKSCSAGYFLICHFGMVLRNTPTFWVNILLKTRPKKAPCDVLPHFIKWICLRYEKFEILKLFTIYYRLSLLKSVISITLPYGWNFAKKLTMAINFTWIFVLLLISDHLQFQLEVTAFSDNITLHVKNLTIPNNKVRLFELKHDSTVENIQNLVKEDKSISAEMHIDDIFYYPKHDYMVIYPKHILSKYRKYVLYIPFSGILDTGLLGYYRSSYVDKKSSRRM